MDLGRRTFFTDVTQLLLDEADEPFRMCFRELSAQGDLHGMIQLVTGLSRMENLVPAEAYVPKDETRCRDFLERAKCTSGEHPATTEHLTEALFATGCVDVYLSTLLERARCWFARASLTRCLADVEHTLSVLADLEASSTLARDHQVWKVESLCLKARCLLRAGREEEARACLKSIKAEINSAIERRITGKSLSNAEQLWILKPLLEQLRVAQLEKEEPGASCAVPRPSVPEVSGERSKLLKSCSDAVVQRRDRKRGRHLVAARNIKVGSVLIVDKPFSFSTDVNALARNCLHCHVSLLSEHSVRFPCRNCQTVSFCSAECERESYRKYHKYECKILGLFYEPENQKRCYLLAYRTTVLQATRDLQREKRLNREFLRLQSAEFGSADEERIGCEDEYDPLDYRTVFSQETNAPKIDVEQNLVLAIAAAVLAKYLKFVLGKLPELTEVALPDKECLLLGVGMLRHMQAIRCNAYDIVENCLDERGREWVPRNVGGAIYTTVSLTNHDCYANVVRHSYPGGVVVVRALRFIEKGSEIVDCYGPNFVAMPKESRRAHLSYKYFFVCTCKPCTRNWTWPLPEARYNCRGCSGAVEASQSQCPRCRTTLDSRKLERLARESIARRRGAIGRMCNGDWAGALPILLEHSNFWGKTFRAPNDEMIKTENCLVQCWNSMGCTGVRDSS